MSTNPQSTQMVNEAALAVTRSAARATQATINANMDAEANTPLRAYASNPIDSKLHIGASQVSGADGSGKSVPPQSGVVNNAWADTTIDFGVTSSWITGGTVTRDGATFSLPTITAGRFLRIAFVFTQAGAIDCSASDGTAVTKGALPNPGTLFAGLTGTKLFWIDLVALSGGQTYKTADSVGASSIIENSVSGTAQIVKFGSGASDSGAQAPLVLQSASTPNVTIAGGYLPLMDGRELTTTDGGTDTANYGKQYTFSATSIQSPAASTVYHFYVDLDTLGSQVTIATGTYTGRKIYTITSANIAISTTAPDSINRSRYVWMGTIKTTSGSAWSGTGASLAPATRMEGLNNPLAVSPVVYRLQKQLIGSVGSAGQIAAGHETSSASFASGMASANRSWYPLTSTADGSGNTRTLSNSNTVLFTATGILGVANKAANFVGTSSQRLFRQDDAHFNPATTNPFLLSMWVKPSSVLGTKVLASCRRYTGGTDINWVLKQINTSLLFLDSTGASILTLTSAFSNGVWVHIGLRFDGSRIYLYVNGRAVDNVAFTANAVTNPEFALGAENVNGTPGAFYSGDMDEVVFIRDTTFDIDMRRLYASRIDHNANVATSFQEWTGKVYFDSDTVSQDINGALIDMTNANSLFVDLVDRLSTDFFELVLKDNALNATVVSGVVPFDTTYSADPTGTVAHGQPDNPEVIVQQETGTAGQWVDLAPLGIVSADANNLTITAGHLSVGVSPNRLRIIARTPRLASVGVPQASTSRLGVVYLGSMTAFNKIVGTGNGSQYSKLSLASLTAGDSVWINSDIAETADLVIPAGVTVRQAPNTKVTITGALTNGVRLTGAKAKWVDMNVQLNPTGTQARGISIEAADCWVEGWVELNTAQTVTDLVHVTSGGLRARAQIGVLKTLGTITNLETNNDGAGSTDVWGG